MRAVGVTQGYLSKLEAGATRNPGLPIVRKLAKGPSACR